MLRALFDDVHSATRSLRREPGFVFMAVVALAVGVGSSATVFGMANQLLLRPVPGVADPDRAAYLTLSFTEIPGVQDYSGLNSHDFDELRLQADLLAGMAAGGFAGIRRLSAPDGRLVDVASSSIYGDYFEVLGVRPRQGRLLRADETGPDANPRVAVIGEALAQRLFGDAGDVPGRTIQVDGESITIRGGG